jgi:hypothetical protein
MKEPRDSMTVYEKGQHFLGLRQRPLSLIPTAAVLVATVAIVVLLAYVGMAALRR